MAIEVGATVFVPFTILDADPTGAAPFFKTTVTDRASRSVKVALRDGRNSKFIGTSRIFSNVGLLIIRIGDYDTEATLLDPLAKSVLQFSRLLLSDDYVRIIHIRTLEELESFWGMNHASYEQVVLIGHGSRNSLTFGRREIGVTDLVAAFDAPNVRPKEFISLCCETGKTAFGRSFSGHRVTADFIAPQGKIHGCTASQFLQSYLTFRLLDGRTIGTAHTKAQSCVLNPTGFRRWHNGTWIQ
jgi:hypothetical protein